MFPNHLIYQEKRRKKRNSYFFHPPKSLTSLSIILTRNGIVVFPFSPLFLISPLPISLLLLLELFLLIVSSLTGGKSWQGSITSETRSRRPSACPPFFHPPFLPIFLIRADKLSLSQLSLLDPLSLSLCPSFSIAYPPPTTCAGEARVADIILLRLFISVSEKKVFGRSLVAGGRREEEEGAIRLRKRAAANRLSRFSRSANDRRGFLLLLLLLLVQFSDHRRGFGLLRLSPPLPWSRSGIHRSFLCSGDDDEADDEGREIDRREREEGIFFPFLLVPSYALSVMLIVNFIVLERRSDGRMRGCVY